MGVSYQAMLVYGLPLNNVLSCKYVENEVTKYHEDTGAPYKAKKIASQPLLFRQPVTIPPVEWDNLRDEYVFSPNNTTEQTVFGIRLGAADDYRQSMVQMEPAKLSEADAELHRLITELCLKYSVQPPTEHNPKLYLILSCS